MPPMESAVTAVDGPASVASPVPELRYVAPPDLPPIPPTAVPGIFDGPPGPALPCTPSPAASPVPHDPPPPQPLEPVPTGGITLQAEKQSKTATTVWLMCGAQILLVDTINLRKHAEVESYMKAAVEACPALAGETLVKLKMELLKLAAPPVASDGATTPECTATESTGASDEGPIPLGTRDPKSQRLVLSLHKTLPTAEAFVKEFYQHAGNPTLYHYADMFWGWDGNRYVEVEEQALYQKLQVWLHRAVHYRSTQLVDFDSNATTISDAVRAVRAYRFLPSTATPPWWLCDAQTLPDPRELLPFRSGVLHVPTGAISSPTPALFNTNALDFDYDERAPQPTRWLAFLSQLFGDDAESIALLQEWAGYCLVADTSQQKILLMVGPKRSGKGTIGRVFTRLVGAGNVIGPTTTSLAGQFGLQPLIGKSLAIVSDARFTGERTATVTERLLCISGEDTLTIDRKFLGGVTMKLPTRFMLLTNELPRLNDVSGALAGRFMILRLTESFYRHEDTQLTDKLTEELPGILLWAIDGLRHLRARGFFLQPQTSADAVGEMEELASPVTAFVRETCEVGAGHRVYVEELYAAWQRWCRTEGRNLVTTKSTFGRDLAAAFPGIRWRRGAGYVAFYDGISARACPAGYEGPHGTAAALLGTDGH